MIVVAQRAVRAYPASIEIILTDSLVLSVNIIEIIS